MMDFSEICEAFSIELLHSRNAAICASATEAPELGSRSSFRCMSRSIKARRRPGSIPSVQRISLKDGVPWSCGSSKYFCQAGLLEMHDVLAPRGAVPTRINRRSTQGAREPSAADHSAERVAEHVAPLDAEGIEERECVDGHPEIFWVRSRWSVQLRRFRKGSRRVRAPENQQPQDPSCRASR